MIARRKLLVAALALPFAARASLYDPKSKADKLVLS